MCGRRSRCCRRPRTPSTLRGRTSLRPTSLSPARTMPPLRRTSTKRTRCSEQTSRRRSALRSRPSGHASRRCKGTARKPCVSPGLQSRSPAKAPRSTDGTVTVRGESFAAVERLRWILALDNDHSDFLRSVRDDPMLGRASRALRGLRPVRVATVAQALLRAYCGQLIEAKRARRLEQTIIRSICAAGPEALHVAPTTDDLGALAPSQLRALGLHARRGASLVRLCRGVGL